MQNAFISKWLSTVLSHVDVLYLCFHRYLLRFTNIHDESLDHFLELIYFEAPLPSISLSWNIFMTSASDRFIPIIWKTSINSDSMETESSPWANNTRPRNTQRGCGADGWQRKRGYYRWQRDLDHHSSRAVELQKDCTPTNASYMSAYLGIYWDRMI